MHSLIWWVCAHKTPWWQLASLEIPTCSTLNVPQRYNDKMSGLLSDSELPSFHFQCPFLDRYVGHALNACRVSTLTLNRKFLDSECERWVKEPQGRFSGRRKKCHKNVMTRSTSSFVSSFFFKLCAGKNKENVDNKSTNNGDDNKIILLKRNMGQAKSCVV